MNIFYSFIVLGCTVAPRGIGIRGSGDPFFLSPIPLNLLLRKPASDEALSCYRTMFSG